MTCGTSTRRSSSKRESIGRSSAKHSVIPRRRSPWTRTPISCSPCSPRQQRRSRPCSVWARCRHPAGRTNRS